MNEEESTFFVTIEKNTMKSQIVNYKNIKEKFFCRPIRSMRKKQIRKNHNHSSSFPNGDLINSMPNIKILPPKVNKINNISKINIMQNYIQKDNISHSFIIENKNKINNNKTQNTNNIIEENIDIDDDMDEYSDAKFNININKPKLPFNTNHYYNNNNIKNKLSSSVSRNVHNSYLNKTSKTNPSVIINKYNNKCKFFRNKSCSFIKNDLLKLRLNQNISIINSKIDMLKNLIKSRNMQILSLQILFEKINTQLKFKKNNKLFDKKIDEMYKEIFNLKMVLSKCEEKFIKKNLLDKQINKEDIIHAIKKAEIIEKIMEYKMLIINKNKKNDYNSNVIYIEESTINNDSFIFENEYNILETKENIKISDRNKNKLKNSREMPSGNKKDEKEDEDRKNKNKNDINCIKNKNVSNYFDRFLIETKNNNKNKNKYQKKFNKDSKFNIFINANKVK